MTVRKAEAVWQGSLKQGKGTMKLGSGAFEGAYSFGTRFEDKKGTNPEELIGAAHAGCYSMALSMLLGQEDYTPERIETRAKVHLEQVDDGFAITTIDLETEAKVPGIDEKTFQEKAEAAKKGCPVSKVLAGAKINLKANLLK